jgi:hypothetical protein
MMAANVKAATMIMIGTMKTISILLAGVSPHALGRTANPRSRLHNLRNRVSGKKMQPARDENGPTYC